MYHYSQQMRQNTGNLRARVRLLAVLLVLVIVACIAFGVMYGRAASFQTTTRTQLVSRIRSCCADTRSLAQKLSSSVQSNTASSLAGIRSGIYAMDQLNNVAVQYFTDQYGLSAGNPRIAVHPFDSTPGNSGRDQIEDKQS